MITLIGIREPLAIAYGTFCIYTANIGFCVLSFWNYLRRMITNAPGEVCRDNRVFHQGVPDEILSRQREA
jgi:hypothetical protein